MPAILKDFLPNRVASLYDIASFGSHAKVGSVGSMRIWNTMPYQPYEKYMRNSQLIVIMLDAITMRYRPM